MFMAKINTAKAKELIKTACGREDADVHLFIGGTQTNFTIISAATRPFQGVYSFSWSHQHAQAGAIEHTGRQKCWNYRLLMAS